jgi:RNA polymerase sigma-70 factor (ECF subfamily)
LARRRSPVTTSSRDTGPGDSLESEWITRAAGGDEGAFRCLVDLYQDRVYGVALRMMKNPDQAADAAQDAFIKAYRALRKFEARSRFGTWIYRITVNVCHDRLAKRPDRPLLPIDDLVRHGQEPVAGPNWDNATDVESAQGAAAFEEELAALSETYRLPFVLRQVEERSYEEIAEILGITVTNAKVRVHRAREALLERLRRRGIL